MVLIAIGVRPVHGTTPDPAILTLVLGWFLAVLFVFVVGVVGVLLILIL